MDLLIQTVGSLVAILALAGLTWWLKLGGAPVLGSEDAVRRAAHEVEDGFDPVAIAYDEAAALAKDAGGRIMVIKRHGSRFVGRLLGPKANARIGRASGEAPLLVDCGEARFGPVSLDIDEPETWADSINRLKAIGHA